MKKWFTSQYRSVAVSLIGFVLAFLALLVVISQQGLSERTTAASLLVLTFAIFDIAGVLFTGRAFLNWQIEDRTAFMRWERGAVITATLANALGLLLLADLLHAAGDTYLAQLGVAAYLFGAALVMVAETRFLHDGEWNYVQVVSYVVLAFLGEAVLGAALLQTGLVAAWVGWTTLLWNLGWLLVMLIVRPRDVYYPVLHYVAPLLIGIALVASGWA